MKEINVEEIMAEIRNEIKEKGFTADMLSFTEISMPSPHVSEFNIDDFRRTIAAIESSKYVPGRTDDNIGHGIKGLIKRVIRKLVWFNIAPMSDKQNIYNDHIATALYQMLSFIELQNTQMEEYDEKIKSLKDELQEMKR